MRRPSWMVLQGRAAKKKNVEKVLVFLLFSGAGEYISKARKKAQQNTENKKKMHSHINKKVEKQSVSRGYILRQNLLRISYSPPLFYIFSFFSLIDDVNVCINEEEQPKKLKKGETHASTFKKWLCFYLFCSALLEQVTLLNLFFFF